MTLTIAGQLNGCIGSIDTREPLGLAAPRLALAAAFADPRLRSLCLEDHPRLTIDLTLLSQRQPIAASSRSQLIAAFRPHVDRLLIEASSTRALFLPAVWAERADAERFIDRLWSRAGLIPRTRPLGRRASRFVARSHRREPGSGTVTAA